MKMTRVATIALLVGLLVAAISAAVGAEEAKTPVSAQMLIKNVLAAPVEQQRQTAFDESLKRDGLPPRSPLGEVQPDGSVRYGSVSVTVKNPCPPGTLHYEPPPLPGRRARN